MTKKKEEEKLYTQVGIKFDKEKWRRLKILAAVQGRTMTKIIDDAISNYLDKFAKGPHRGNYPEEHRQMKWEKKK